MNNAWLKTAAPTVGVHLLRMGQAVCMASLGGLLPATAKDLDFPLDQFRWPMLLFAVGYLLGAPLLRLSRRAAASWAVAAMACVAATAGVLMWGNAHSVQGLALAMFVFGLSGIWQEMGSNPLMAELFPRRLAGALAWLHGLYCLWAFLGPQLSGLALKNGLSWRVTPTGASLCFVLALVCLLVGQGAARKETPAVAVQEAVPAAPVLSPFRFPWLLALMVVVYSGASFTLNAWAPSILHHRFTLTEARAATLIGGYYGLMGVGRVLWGVLVNRLGAGPLLALTAGLSALTHLCLWAAGSENLAVWSLWLTGMFVGAIVPLALTLEGERQPWFMSHITQAVFMALGVGLLIGPPTAGWVARRFGLDVILSGSLFLNLLTAILTVWLVWAGKKSAQPIASPDGTP